MYLSRIARSWSWEGRAPSVLGLLVQLLLIALLAGLLLDLGAIALAIAFTA